MSPVWRIEQEQTMLVQWSQQKYMGTNGRAFVWMHDSVLLTKVIQFMDWINFFQQMASDSLMMEEFEEEIKLEIEMLKNDRIDYLTLEQGTSCWHRGRQFSLTSSQASGPFGNALIVYQNNGDWCNVAEYLHGLDYHECKLFRHIFLVKGFFSYQYWSTHTNSFLSFL